MPSSSAPAPAAKVTKTEDPGSSNNAPATSETAADTQTDTPTETASDTPSETPSDTPTEATSDTPTPTPEPSTTSAAPSSETPTTSSTTSSSPTPTTSETPTTTTTPETTSTPDSTVITKVSTASSSDGNTAAVTTVVITSTDSPTQTGNSASDATGTSSGSAALATAGASGQDSGLSTKGTIAVAVVVPVVSVALILVLAWYLWRRWKAKKLAEEERRKEVEDYGFNPNNDPSLPPFAGGAAMATQDDTSGYRGWGATSSGRKASTNLSSGMGLAMSEAGSGAGYHHTTSPSEGTIQYSDGRPTSGEAVEPVGILGSAPPVAANNRVSDIHRGPSNASSAYSGANRSEASDDSHMSASHPTAPFYEENPYYGDTQQQYTAYTPYTPYSEGAAQPVIRDVQARRNTRIENPAVVPRQGNAGIAQNF